MNNRTVKFFAPKSSLFEGSVTLLRTGTLRSSDWIDADGGARGGGAGECDGVLREGPFSQGASQGVDTQPVLVTSVLPPFTAFRGYLHV